MSNSINGGLDPKVLPPYSIPSRGVVIETKLCIRANVRGWPDWTFFRIGDLFWSVDLRVSLISSVSIATDVSPSPTSSISTSSSFWSNSSCFWSLIRLAIWLSLSLSTSLIAQLNGSPNRRKFLYKYDNISKSVTYNVQC